MHNPVPLSLADVALCPPRTKQEGIQEIDRNLVENSPFGVYVVDADFRLAYISVGAHRVFENVRPLLGRDFAEVLRVIWPEPFATEAIERFRHTLATGEPYHAPNTVERRNDVADVEAYDWKIERVMMPDARYGVVCHFYDLSERQRYEARLRESQQFIQELTAVVPGVLYVFDLRERRTVYVNQQTGRVLGFDDAHILSLGERFLPEAICPDDVAKLESHFAQVAELRDGETREIEYRFRHRDGSYRWFRSRDVVFKRDAAGNVWQVLGIATDITDQKKAETEFLESDRRFRATFEQVAVGIAHVGLDGRWLQINQRLCDMVGYSREELRQRTYQDITPLEDVEDDLTQAARALSGEITSYRMEKRYITKSGSLIWAQLTVSLVRNEQDEPLYFISVVEDITERKRWERHRLFLDDLNQTLSHLSDDEAIMSAAGEAIARHMGLLHCLFVEISEAEEIATVVHDRNAPGTPSLVGIYRLSDFHSEAERRSLTDGQVNVINNVRHNQREIKATERSEALGIGSLVNAPYVRDGRWKFTLSVQRGAPCAWSADETELLRDLAGRLYIRMERARAESALRESEEKLRRLAEHSPVAVAMFDREMRYLAVSQRWIQDYSLQTDIIGRSHEEVFPEVTEEWKAIYRRCLTGAIEKAEEERFDRADGSVRWLRWEARPWRDAAGKIGGVIILTEEITARKEAEDRIRDLNARLHRAVFEGSHRIKNHLQALAGLVSMQLLDGREQIAADELRRLRGHIQALSVIHDVMTFTTRENAENDILPLRPIMERVLDLLEQAAGGHRVHYTVEDALLPAKCASAIVLALNELVSNASKHGKGDVEVTFRIHDGEGVLEVCDAGTGFPDGFDPAKAANTGLQLLEAIASTDLNGRIAYSNHPGGGGRVRIIFPLPDTPEPRRDGAFSANS